MTLRFMDYTPVGCPPFETRSCGALLRVRLVFCPALILRSERSERLEG
jgi:hypothetical protein